jgi:hypothetical protein
MGCVMPQTAYSGNPTALEAYGAAPRLTQGHALAITA